MKIRRLLVAECGEMARRILRTAQRMGIETVAVHGQHDGAALHVREATIAVGLGGRKAGESYLHRSKILAAARATDCDAVHPGAAGLALDADFAQSVADAGFTWIGPPPEAIRTLCDSRRARQLAQARGIPCALVESIDRPARRIEVQVFADLHGNCVHLGEREVSMRGLLDESPSPAVDHGLRARLGQAAVDLARAAGLAGTGTMTFLLEDGGFALLSVRTGLQRSQAVTELVTGHDLVDWQLRTACGERLPCKQAEIGQHGHAVAAHLCAEDEVTSPAPGTVQQFVPPPLGEAHGGAVLRFEHAIHVGLQVAADDEPPLGQLLARAASRAEAIDRLATALDRLRLLGLPTNRRFLAACLRHPSFSAEGASPPPALAQHRDDIREELAGEEFGVAAEAALSALLPLGASPVLPSPFVRPLRVRHRGAVLDVPLCEAEGIAAGQAHTVPVGGRRWHVQVGPVDLFIEDASFDPPAAPADEDSTLPLR